MSATFDTMGRGARMVVAMSAGLATACSLMTNLDGFLDEAPISSDDADASVAIPGADGAIDAGDAGATNPDAATSAYAAEVLADNPLGYWRFGEDGGMTAKDRVGANDGIYTLGTTLGVQGAIAGDSDTAVTFDGTRGAVTVPGSPFEFTDKSPFSVELWIKPSVLDDSVRFPLRKEADSPRQGWGIYLSATDTLMERVRDDNWDLMGGAGIALPLDQYSHVVFAFDGTTGVFYLNGTVTDSRPLSQSLVATGTNLYIGGAPFTGTLDEVAIYDHVVAASRVLAHYQRGTLH